MAPTSKNCHQHEDTTNITAVNFSSKNFSGLNFGTNFRLILCSKSAELFPTNKNPTHFHSPIRTASATAVKIWYDKKYSSWKNGISRGRSRARKFLSQPQNVLIFKKSRNRVSCKPFHWLIKKRLGVDLGIMIGFF